MQAYWDYFKSGVVTSHPNIVFPNSCQFSTARILLVFSDNSKTLELKFFENNCFSNFSPSIYQCYIIHAIPVIGVVPPSNAIIIDNYFWHCRSIAFLVWMYFVGVHRRVSVRWLSVSVFRVAFWPEEMFVHCCCWKLESVR